MMRPSLLVSLSLVVLVLVWFPKINEHCRVLPQFPLKTRLLICGCATTYQCKFPLVTIKKRRRENIYFMVKWCIAQAIRYVLPIFPTHHLVPKQPSNRRHCILGSFVHAPLFSDFQ
ncbi:hypothetical protein SETIT_5G237200v2 [Setaria italica]|uniref:Secreted protein n=2 Tax=Setaria TaxID=4554 RepID=A0A368R8C4_SETIT|nr:hypothetical protein SETIT_5G237200v2 [Setaria italica]TKW15550.1 hypothetical protein SEVIR_5G244800v2 [Setaria viridis]